MQTECLVSSLSFFLPSLVSGWVDLVFKGRPSQDTEDLTSRMKKWHGTTLTQNAKLDGGCRDIEACFLTREVNPVF